MVGGLTSGSAAELASMGEMDITASAPASSRVAAVGGVRGEGVAAMSIEVEGERGIETEADDRGVRTGSLGSSGVVSGV